MVPDLISPEADGIVRVDMRFYCRFHVRKIHVIIIQKRDVYIFLFPLV